MEVAVVAVREVVVAVARALGSRGQDRHAAAGAGHRVGDAGAALGAHGVEEGS
jgi:hypothetical protein